jgi:hypothetical protein
MTRAECENVANRLLMMHKFTAYAMRDDASGLAEPLAMVYATSSATYAFINSGGDWRPFRPLSADEWGEWESLLQMPDATRRG